MQKQLWKPKITPKIKPKTLLAVVGSVLILIYIIITQLPPKKDPKQKSYLGKANLPPGIRNNNPGNIIRSAYEWKGKIPITQSSSSRFEQFIEYRYGVRALLKDLTSKIKSVGSIEEIIRKYAPPTENNTEKYIVFVADDTGFPRDQALITTRLTLLKLSQAITNYENGAAWRLTEEDFNEAYKII